MTAPPTLPSVPGLSWSRHKSPKFNTRVASHVSGREVRVALMAYPLYEFEATYPGLASTSAYGGLGAQSLQTLMGFHLQMQGQFNVFLYVDPDDNTVTGQALGIGDGVTTTFAVARTLGGFTEPVGWVTALNNVYLNGLALPSSSYYVAEPNMLVFDRAPYAGAAITADFAFAYQCRFTTDQMDFEEFMSGLWKLDSMKFRSVKVGSSLATPSWLPTPQGITPILYADFINGNYWYNGSSYSTFASWVTATGGSFTRANASLYTGSDGYLHSAAANAPRFDYDPVTLKPVGLMLEPECGNNLLWSQAFSNSVWTKTNCTEADNSVKAPDSTTTGALLTESGSGSIAHELSQSVSASSLSLVTIYARAGTGRYLNVAVSTANANEYAQAVFDLIQGGGATEISVGSYTISNASINITQAWAEPAPDAGDGWYRCILHFTFASNPTAVTFHFGIAAAAHGNTYSTSGQELHASTGRTLYLWGAQVPGSPNMPVSYCATTSSLAPEIGGEAFYLGAAWDNAAQSLTYVQEYDARSLNSFGGNVTIGGGYYGSGQDSWSINNPPQTQAAQEPSGNTAITQTTALPGVNADAIRVDSTVVTIADNGGPTVASSAGTARTAMTKLSPGSYEAGSTAQTAPALRLRRIMAFQAGLSSGSLSSLSMVPGMPVPALASTIDTDANWVQIPGFCVLPSGYLLATYTRYHTATQGALPSQIMYTTAPGPAGPWSTPAVAVANSNNAIDMGAMPLATVGSTVLGILDQLNFTSPYTGGAGTLQIVTGTENSNHSVSWSSPATITGSPFFGADAAGTVSGDYTSSAPILLPNGMYMLLLYGYQSGASVTSVGAIFSTTPTVASSWGNFTIIANGAAFSQAMAFSEANAFIDASSNIVVIMRQDVGTLGEQVPNTSYWRVICPAGNNPTSALNWNAPTLLAFDGTVGKPDVLGLGNNGVWLMTRGATGSNQVIGYNVSWNAAQAPFPGNRQTLLNPTFYDTQYWYSQSQLLSPGLIGTVLGAGGNGIYFIESPFVGVGQSQ